MFTPTRRQLIEGAAALAAANLARPAPAEAPTVEGLGEDVDLLARAYGAIHPGLHRYNTPARMTARFDALARWARTPRGEAEAYLAFARITAAVRCGHSYPNFYNQSKATRETLFAGRRLPFHFDWIDGRMILLRDLSGIGLGPGTEIVAIDGVAARHILAALMPLSRADGSNDGKRVRNLAVHGADRWEAFDLYLPMLMPHLFARDSARLETQGIDGRVARVTVPLLTPAQREAAQGTPAERPRDAPMWTFAQSGDVARLTMPDWGVYASDWKWEPWLAERLDAIAGDGTRALVVDLRGNEGGQDCGDPILARLIDRDLPDPGGARLVRYRRLPADLGAHVDTWDDSFRDWGDKAIGPDKAGWYRLVKWGARGDIIRPAGKRFRGRVVVLTDAANSSATFQFVQRVRDGGLGTLVGATTGGNRRGINGSGFLFPRLPRSGIEVDIPLVGVFPAVPQPDAGIVPDVAVATTPADIAAGADPAWERALALARA